MLWGAAKKAAELTGIIEPATESESPEPIETFKPSSIKKTVDLKPVGNVAPYLKVVDPSEELSILKSLFGDLSLIEEIELSCPDCGEDEDTILMKDAPSSMTEDCECSDCGMTNGFEDWIMDENTRYKSEREPSPSQLEIVTDGCSCQLLEPPIESLIQYYSILLGKEEVVINKYNSDLGPDKDGIYRMTLGPDGPVIGNQRMQWYGSLKPLPKIGVINLTEECDDDEEDFDY